MNRLFKTYPTLICSAFLLLNFQSSAQVEVPSFSSFANQEAAEFRPLSSEEAFPFYVSELASGAYRVTWTPAEEHYLYKRAFNFSFHPTADSEPQTVSFVIPPGLEKTDEFFGEVEVYYSQLQIDLQLPAPAQENAHLIIEYQGCADWGFCYPPQEYLFQLN